MTNRRLYRRVIVESPFGGPTPHHQEENLRYLRACMRDCLDRGEAPFASHGLYTQPGVLNDWDPQEREKGILAGFEWRLVAQATIVYADRGISSGMRAGIRKATELQSHGTFDHYVEYRFLGGEWSALGGPEEIRRHLDDLLKDEHHKHRHLALVTGPAGSQKHVQMISTPAELSMAHVAVVRREGDQLVATTIPPQTARLVPVAPDPLRGPSGLEDPVALEPVPPLTAVDRVNIDHTHASPSKVPPLNADELEAIELSATIGAGVPSRSYTRDAAKQAAAEAQLDRISEATRFAENRMIQDAKRCPEWIRWKPNQGMLDGQCKLSFGHLGDHDYASVPCAKDPPLCTCPERPDPDWNGKHEDDCPWKLWNYARLIPKEKYEGEFGEAAPPKKRSTLDPYLNYQYDGQKPLTLDEVKDALKKGGDERKEAEETIKRPPRH